MMSSKPSGALGDATADVIGGTTPEARAAPTGDTLAALLDASSAGQRRGWLWGGALLLALAIGAAVWLRPASAPDGPRYVTASPRVGDLRVQVSATGNLEPTNRVDVSSELSGIVVEVMVEENDRVTAGQVVARLDLARLKDAVTMSKAALTVAEAQVRQARATVDEARAQLERFEKVSAESGGKVPSQSEMATARANLERARATAASARATVSQARASVQSDETNLDKASIRSPIDGVVLTRDVEPGQTVAAALQAPVLFTLAEDLTQMKLEVDVDEADVGQVRAEQSATFTVDAWPGRTYTGVITRVGYGSETTDNVVTYPAVIAVRNEDLSLRPGMTATADIVTVTRQGVLQVPNAALRFQPALGGPGGGPGSGPPSAPNGGPPGGGIMGKLMPRPPGGAPKKRLAASEGAPTVWVLRAGRPVPIEVQVGVSDGGWTEVTGGDLTPEMEVITEAMESST